MDPTNRIFIRTTGVKFFGGDQGAESEETEVNGDWTLEEDVENGGHVDSLNLGVMLACTPGPSGHHNLFE